MTATQLLSEDALTVRETAARLGVSIRQVMTLVADGKLSGSYKLGLIRLIPRRAVEERMRQVKQWKARHA
jgi:excisionase family DNA binding protein